MVIRRTERTDTEAILLLFAEARGTIAKLGIDQWQNGYPSKEVLESDIGKGQSYCVLKDGSVCGTMAILTDGEPTYDKIYDGEWLSGSENRSYLAIHRVAVALSCRGGGVSGAIMTYAEGMAREMGREALRIDTHRGNVVMRKMLEKNGFEFCGLIYLENGDERVAYEKILERVQI